MCTPHCRNLTFSLTCTVEMLNLGHRPCLNVSSPGGRHRWGKEEGQREVEGLMVLAEWTPQFCKCHFTNTAQDVPPHTLPLFSLLVPFSLFSLQYWPNNWHVQFWPPPFAPSHQVSFESSALALQNSIVFQPAWGCLRGLCLKSPFFPAL